MELSALVADETTLGQLLDRFYPEERSRGRLVTMRTLDGSAIAGLVASNASSYAAEELKLERLGPRIWVPPIRVTYGDLSNPRLDRANRLRTRTGRFRFSNQFHSLPLEL